MKKILLVALTVLMCSASFAQFRMEPRLRDAAAPKGTTDLITWGQIGTPFVANDINNNSIDLGAILSSGMSVVIDYSCCWCNPCWNCHQAGVLEAINSMDSVQVIWVESESTNTLQQIYGVSTNNSYSGYTCGNWTVDANNNPVSYPIIDDDAAGTCLSTCYSLYEGYVPTVFYISPEGYFCSIYAESYGVSSSTSATAAIQAIQNLINSRPQAGQVPVVELSGNSNVLVNSSASFSANIISVDPITDITWTFSNGNPATATGQIASTTWSSTGNETVTVSVTNTTGTTTATLNVSVFDYTWGDEMDYTNGGQYENAIGLDGGGAFTWGVKYPASLLVDRNYLKYVKIFGSSSNTTLTLTVYQTDANNIPSSSDVIYTYNYPVAAGTWNTLNMFDAVPLNSSKDLWITFTGSGYVATGCAYNGDPNTALIELNGSWSTIQDASSNRLSCTWMIKTTTSATVPPMSISINGPTEGQGNETVTFTAVGTMSATYSWNFEGGNPATATGMTASTVFTTAGNHTVTLTATRDGEITHATHTINIVICEAQTLPWSCGFESNDNLGCWKFIDQDGDGYGWKYSSEQFNSFVHSGSDALISASYINDIGALHPDNFAITPKLIIPSEGATLEWWDAPYQAEYPDSYGVFVSTTGNAPADFTSLVFNGPVGSSWTKHSCSLAGFAGQEIYVAFRHYNISDAYWFGIDDIKVTAGNTAGITEAENANVVLYPNPVNDKLNIVAEGIQEVNVLDINGRTVMTLQNTNTIDMSTMANGVYFVRVITANGVSTQKIVKK